MALFQALLSICGLFGIVLASQHNEQHALLVQRDDSIHARQNAVTSVFSSTLVFSYTSWTPVTATDATTFSATLATSTAVLTVTAEDQFHALQAFLTAGQSVINSVSSSAAQVTMSPTLPASTSVEATATMSPTLLASTSVEATTTMTLTSSSLSMMSVTSSQTPTTSTATQQGGSEMIRPDWFQQWVTFMAAALFWGP